MGLLRALELMEGEPVSGFSSVRRRRTAVERSSKVSRQAAEEETLTVLFSREGKRSGGRKSQDGIEKVRRVGEDMVVEREGEEGRRTYKKEPAERSNNSEYPSSTRSAKEDRQCFREQRSRACRGR